MGRPVGRAKTGGRKKGTPNKRSLEFSEALRELAFSPVDELVRQIRGEHVSALDRARLCLEMLPYLFPRRKPIELPKEENRVAPDEVIYVASWGSPNEA